MPPNDADRTPVQKMAAECRSWPRPLRFTAAAMAGVLVLAPVLIGIADAHHPVPPGNWSDSSMAAVDDLPSYTPPPAGEESAEVTFPAYTGDPAWTYESGGASSVVPTDQGFVVYDSGTLRLDEDGTTVWEHSWVERAERYLVADQTVLVVTANPDGWEWPARQTVEAFDLASGEERWSDDEVSYGEFVGGRVFTSSCDAKAADGGTCVLSERDAASGAVVWSVDDVGASQASALREDTLLVFTSEHGLSEGVQYTARDASSGQITGIDHVDADSESDPVLADGMVLFWLDWDGDPTEGCTANVRAFPEDSGSLAWEFDSTMRKSEDLSSCGAQPMTEPVDGALAVTDGQHPALLDARTGQIEWTGEAEGQALGTDGRVLAALDWDGETDNLAGYDTATGEELWRVTAPVNYYTRTYVVGSTMWIFSEGTAFGRFFNGLYAVDLRDGALVELPGEFKGGKDSEMHTEEEGTFYAWPFDLFAHD